MWLTVERHVNLCRQIRFRRSMQRQMFCVCFEALNNFHWAEEITATWIKLNNLIRFVWRTVCMYSYCADMMNNKLFLWFFSRAFAISLISGHSTHSSLSRFLWHSIVYSFSLHVLEYARACVCECVCSVTIFWWINNKQDSPNPKFTLSIDRWPWRKMRAQFQNTYSVRIHTSFTQFSILRSFLPLIHMCVKIETIIAN